MPGIGRVLPRPEQAKESELPINKTLSHTKTLSEILEAICTNGSMSEIEFFSHFPNRKHAIEAIRHLTGGKYHQLGSFLQDGQRFYFCTRYACQDRETCRGER